MVCWTSYQAFYPLRRSLLNPEGCSDSFSVHQVGEETSGVSSLDEVRDSFVENHVIEHCLDLALSWANQSSRSLTAEVVESGIQSGRHDERGFGYSSFNRTKDIVLSWLLAFGLVAVGLSQIWLCHRQEPASLHSWGLLKFPIGLMQNAAPTTSDDRFHQARLHRLSFTICLGRVGLERRMFPDRRWPCGV